MSDNSLGTPAQLRDPNYTPAMSKAVPLGIQHVLAMFVSNVTPAIIIAFAAGFGFGSPDAGTLVYLIQMSMLFAGIATLMQTIGMGPVGARLPIVQGTSFAYLPVMIPAMAGAGVAGLSGLMMGVIVGGIFHFCIGFFIKRIRFALPPLVTGLIVLMIGLALVKVGIQYAAGGVPAIGKPEFGSLLNWFVAFVVIAVTLCVKFFSRGFLSVAAVLIGLIAGYIVALLFGMVSFGGVGRAAWFAFPNPLRWGLEWNWAIIIGMCLMSFISAIETVGDTSGITKGGAGREATDDEVQGATFADGLGTALAGLFGGLPNTSFSQNVGLISMTGVMSRGVVTIGAIFLIICGFIPKIGAVISTVPIEVLGGGVIIMFGMVASAGVKMLSDVVWNRRNMIIFATALSIGLGLQLVPEALQHVGGTWKILLTSGLLPAAFIAIVLNLLLPTDLDDDDGASAHSLAGLDNSGSTSTGDGTSSGSGAASGTAGSTAAAFVGAGAATAAAGAASATSSSSASSGSASTGGNNSTSSSDNASTMAKSSSAAASTSAAAKSGSGAGRGASSAAKLTSGGATPAAKSSTKKASATKAAGAGGAKSATAKSSAATKGASGSSTSKTAAAKSAGSKASASKASASKAASTKSAVAKSSGSASSGKKAPAKKAAAKSSASKGSSSAAAKIAKLTGSALDDLEFVDGIGPKTAKSLQNAGVKNLSGLIAMADEALEAAAQKAGTGGRPEGEKWKKQAKDILSGKPPQAKSDRAAWERAKKKT